MGMYTELCLALRLKKDTPAEIIRTIHAMIGGDPWKASPPDTPDHPLFSTDRWHWMLVSGGSYYFDAIGHTKFEYDDISKSWYLDFRRDIKNYTGEWEQFLSWIGPYVDVDADAGEDPEFVGYYRYEEDQWPTLVVARDGGLHLHGISVDGFDGADSA